MWFLILWRSPAGQSASLTGTPSKDEKDLILRVLAATNGAQAEAARRMGLSRSALAYKLNKYGMRSSDPEGSCFPVDGRGSFHPQALQ